MRTFGNLLALLFIVLLPLDSVDFIDVWIGNLRVTALDVLIAIMLFVVFCNSMLQGLSVDAVSGRVIIVMLAIIILSMISLMYLPLGDSFPDIKYTINFVEFLSLMVVLPSLLNNMNILKLALRAYLVGVVIISAITISMSLGYNVYGSYRGEARHIGGLIIGVTGLTHVGLAFSSLILLGLPLCLTEFIIKSRTIRVVALLLLVAASLIAYSRGLYVAIALQIVASIIIYTVRTRGSVKRAVMYIVLVCASLLLISRGYSLYSAVYMIRPATVIKRLSGYWASIELATSNPVDFMFGVGQGVMYWRLNDYTVPHNIFLELLVSKGVFVMMLFAYLLYLLVREIMKLIFGNIKSSEPVYSFAYYCLLSLTGFIAMGMVAPVVNAIEFWAICALSLTCVKMARTDAAKIRLL